MQKKERKQLKLPFFQPTFIDLFSGIGGLSLGFKKAGFIPKFAFDRNCKVLEVYKRNIKPLLAICADYQELDISKIPKCDIVIGGPPCQGFSKINRVKYKDEYKKLNDGVIFFANVVAYLKPKLFLFENVSTTIKTPQFKYLLENLKDFRIEYKIVDLGLYGGGPWEPKQPLTHRKRLIAIGIRKDIDKGLDLFPIPISDKPLPIDEILKISKEVIEKDLNKRRYRQIPKRLKPLLPYIERGKNRLDIPKELHKYFYETWLKNPRAYRDSFTRCGVGKPLPYVTGGILTADKGRYIHPTEDRGFTAEEAKYIMSFPQDFEFGEAALGLIEQALGNAVPPQAAFAFAKHIKKLLSISI